MKLDGKEIAQHIYDDLTQRVAVLQKKNITPELAIVIIGDDPASLAYVAQKEKHAAAIGAHATLYRLSTDVTNHELYTLIHKLNDNSTVHGCIIQRPTPQSIILDLNTEVVAKKDVDGFHPKSPYDPPIALAVWEILHAIFDLLPPPGKAYTFDDWVMTQKIVVIGKGEAGGKPIIEFLQKRNIPLQIIDSKTVNPTAVTKQADILIPSVGKKGILTKNMVRPGAVVIGVGMYKGDDKKLHADYELADIENLAGFYTPVPGGVGPVNVATLLSNLVIATEEAILNR